MTAAMESVVRFITYALHRPYQPSNALYLSEMAKKKKCGSGLEKMLIQQMMQSLETQQRKRTMNTGNINVIRAGWIK
jgi:hypothetical protein